MTPSSHGQTERRANSCMVRTAPCPMGRPHLRPGAHGRKSCSYLVCFLRVGVGSASPEHCQAGSHTSRLWAAVLPASAGYSTLIPSTRAAGTWIQRRSPGTLNEAVNEEVSSLKPSGRRPPNVLTSGPPFSQTPPLLQGPSNWFPAASSAPCWQCCCSRGARTASPGYGTRHHQPPAPSACLPAGTFFVLFLGTGPCPFARSRESGTPCPHH